MADWTVRKVSSIGVRGSLLQSNPSRVRCKGPYAAGRSVASISSEPGRRSVASPLLANIYLDYVFDLWADRWRWREATGGMIIVRYADDIVVGFEHEADAQRFRASALTTIDPPLLTGIDPLTCFLPTVSR
ncbi:MAG: RNA-directed polymerase [Acetobacteraceae bacterium]|jgi:hypothetical protein|nr:RNA-directed polymerase [Acetobacteraceae bacterium]